MSRALADIPSEIVNLYEAHTRRVQRRKENFDAKSKELAKALEPFVAEYNKAVRDYEDHFDGGLLKYRRDPNKMVVDERDPQEVKQARKLKRLGEDAEIKVRKNEAELTAVLRETPEFKSLQAAQHEFEDWLAGVCLFLKCCAAELDWQNRKINRAPTDIQVPAELLAFPK